MSRRARLFTLMLASLLTQAPCRAQSAPAGAQGLKTAAEASDFKSTTRHRDLLEFLDACAAGAPHLRRLDFGSTVEGRPLAAAIVARSLHTCAHGVGAKLPN